MFRYIKVFATTLALIIIVGRYSYKTEIVYSNTLIEGPDTCSVSVWFRETYDDQSSLYIPLLYIHEEKGRPFKFSISLTGCDNTYSLIKLDNVQLSYPSGSWPYPDGVINLELQTDDFINAYYRFESPIPNPFLDNEHFNVGFRLRAYRSNGQPDTEKSYTIPVTASKSEGSMNLLFYAFIVMQGA
ncbi:hypothetical protein GZ77_11050 [Endozoicomonas montiporae]|uniref:Uncharacterized protein n=2 Tax=Endozoicomonas montiporae TaxID=1027273 RepID=A0A081N8N4_9GAMM|nr:hypothetical protein [Endozoicomonas montiporae]AMO55290.1 hypothetical protein EZMO1_1086 [Endozoicomonas montiporae CL-33]KEQ12695.1 hypothetical protein GZ77_19625 [Endozoicomonas montiporae]KEQ14807.1 hypothetical protein GZ77_11050 [Endozoicomonas montiporae]